MATNEPQGKALSKRHADRYLKQSQEIVYYKGGWYYVQSAGNNFWWIYRGNLPGTHHLSVDQFVHGTHLVWSGVKYSPGRKKKYTEAELGAH